MLRAVKDLLLWGLYRRRFPHSRVALGARVSSGARLSGDSIEVGAGALIHESALHGPVVVEPAAQVSNSTITGPARVGTAAQVHGCSIGWCSYVARAAGLADTRIGRFCSIGPEVLCGLGTHPTRLLSTSPVFYSKHRQCGVSFGHVPDVAESRPIEVGNDVWIGARAIVMDGVKIADGAVIGAGAVVTRDVRPYAIVGGVPAREIRRRFPDETVQALLNSRWWEFGLDQLRAAQPWMCREDPGAFLDWAASQGLTSARDQALGASET